MEVYELVYEIYWFGMQMTRIVWFIESIHYDATFWAISAEINCLGFRGLFEVELKLINENSLHSGVVELISLKEIA